MSLLGSPAGACAQAGATAIVATKTMAAASVVLMGIPEVVGGASFRRRRRSSRRGQKIASAIAGHRDHDLGIIAGFFRPAATHARHVERFCIFPRTPLAS